MSTPRLLVIADYDYDPDEARWLAALREVGAAMRGRDCAVQVRARSAGDAQLQPLAEKAREAVPGDTPLFLNGPAELARRLGYSGVHWRQEVIPDTPCRLDMTKSAAVHDEASLQRAQRAGADFAVFGSVFDPGSKAGRGVGTRALAGMTATATVPILAVGGVSVDRVGECIAAGASGVAVISGVMGAPSPAAAAVAYLDRLTEVCA